MPKRRLQGGNDTPRAERAAIRGNPRKPSFAMSMAVDAVPLGVKGTISRVTKQKYNPRPLSMPRASFSLDSISDHEEEGQEYRVRSHINPKKNSNPFAEIRAPRVPQAPHDPRKPAVMKHPDLPSRPIYRTNSESTSSNTVSSCSFTSVSSLSSNCDPPSHKIARLSTTTPKMEVKEEPVVRSTKKEVNRSEHSCTVPARESKKEIIPQIRRDKEVETPKARVVPTEPKKEVKEEIVEKDVKMEMSKEREENEDEMEDAEDTEDNRGKSRLKMKKSIPSEELARKREAKEKIVKKDAKKEEPEVITID